jgi:hypothetical protein
MKSMILLLAVLASGCSTIGHVEGTGEVGKLIRTVESVQCRASKVSCNHGNIEAVRINKTVGEIKSIQDQPMKLESIPYILQQIGSL